MKIFKVRTRVFEWQGDTVPPQPNFCTNAVDMLGDQTDSMVRFRFHSWAIVEVETDAGWLGIGNAALAPRLIKAIIDDYLAPLIIGEDPWNYEVLWQRMYRNTLAWGRKGVAMAAISAIDIAIWDLLGHAVGQPVFKMLGGRTKATIPCYASKLYHQEPANMQAEAQSYVDQGFQAFKMRLGYGPRHGPSGVRKNLDAITAVREVVGYDRDLMVDCYMGWDFDYARRMLPKLEKFELRWLEEPLIADDIDGYAELNRRSTIPIAGGEHEFTPYGFKQLLDKNAIAVAQYDTNRVGGITVARKINALCEAHSVPVVPHAGQMHNFHLTMSSLNAPISEFFPVHDVEIGNELFYYIFEGEPHPSNGEIDLTDDQPGLGLSIRNEGLDRFSIIE